MVSLSLPRQSAIMFDLGAAGIRAAQFRGRPLQPRLCDALQFDRQPSLDADEPPPPTVDPAQLARLIGQGRFSGRTVGLVVSPPEVAFFPLSLPEPALQQSPERVQQALKWEVARASRGSADEFEVRYWRLPKGHGQPANVMAVALPTAVAMEWCARFEQQQLALERIDVSPCALVRSACALWAPAANEIWGVLDLGLRHTTLAVVAGGVPMYIRSLSVTAHQWTQKLAQAFEVPVTMAEQLKRDHGVQPSDSGLAPRTAGRSLLQAEDLPSACYRVLRETLQLLAQEIGRCFAYVLNSFPEHSIKGLMLAGGGVRMPGLPECLRRELDIPVRLLSTVVSGETPADAASPEAGRRSADFDFPTHAAAALGGALLDLESS